MTLLPRAVAPLDATDAGSLQAELAPLGLLHDVIGWAARRTPLARVEDVVVQDEFTHDVVVALGGARWLVFDTT